MAVPIYHDKSGLMIAPSGSTFHSSGTILHPAQISGRIPLAGKTWNFSGAGTMISHVLHNLARSAPLDTSGE